MNRILPDSLIIARYKNEPITSFLQCISGGKKIFAVENPARSFLSLKMWRREKERMVF